MTRDLPSYLAGDLQGGTIRLVLLAKFEFPSGALNLWSGVGDLTFAGETYTGAGDLAQIGAVRETARLRAAALGFTLSGAPASLVSIALAENYQDRPVTLWLATLREGAASGYRDRITAGTAVDRRTTPAGEFRIVRPQGFVIGQAAAYPLFKGRMDTMRIRDQADQSTIEVVAENVLAELERPGGRRWTPEDQKLDWPNDTGFDQVATLAQAQIDWGQPST